MDKALSELIRMSNSVGGDSSLVQAGGGNTSVKSADGRYMYIKASGTGLKNMNAQAGWRKLRLEPVLAILSDASIARLDTQTREAEIVYRLLAACDDNFSSDIRPSLEAHFHALLGRCVIHLHPDAVCSYVSAKNGRTELEKLFRDENYPPAWVPYTGLGYRLAKKIENVSRDYKNQYGKGPAVMFLQNHGVLVATGSSSAAVRLVRKVINRCSSRLTEPKTAKVKSVNQNVITDTKLCIRRAVFDATGRYTAVSHFSNARIAAFARHKNAAKMLSPAALTPDELLYANGPAMWMSKCDSKKISAGLSSQINKGRNPSAAFLVKDVGLFITGREKLVPAIKDIVLSSLFIRTNALRLGGILSLKKAQEDFINRWETDAFRKKLASGSGRGPLQDRIAVVTGAGSGLGKSIAVGLSRAGAVVGILDIDVKAAEQTRAVINNELPEASAAVIRCDVTNERSVDEAMAGVVQNRGGLDILVNAAGIAPAYPLVELPVEKWRCTLEVNLTGYFLCAKAAARIMIKQGIGGSIINISSKSGLDASRDNTPYNATKAGEIHMARGWALELGEYGIRVNSVCPGNVFEGSKIWNREYIKVCAEKYGIKPEEVIPYYINKTCLKREIKGQDVADSVVFLCSDKARTITGQVLVPDSGQVMVR